MADMRHLTEEMARLLEQWCGLIVPPYHLPRLEVELMDLALDRLTTSELRERFQRDVDLRSKVLARVAIPETFFFRYFVHFEILREEARRHPAGARPFRVLSAGCATGEEAWSAAAVLAAELGYRPTPRFEVVGLDMVDANLLRAIEGRYGAWSIRNGLQGYERFFRRTPRGCEVGPELRPRVRFEIANLLKTPFNGGPFDVVLFRNVAMYWKEGTLRGVLRRLADAIRPGGTMLVGPNDPIPTRIESFRRESREGVRVYRRCLPGEPVEAAPSSKPARPAGPGGAAPRPSRPNEPRRPRSHRVHRPHPTTPSPRAPQPQPHLDQVQGLANRGDYEAALSLLGNDNEPSAQEQMWRGILLLNLERPQEALSAFRYCVYLESRNPLYRRWMAATYELLGLGDDAAREYRNVEDLEST